MIPEYCCHLNRMRMHCKVGLDRNNSSACPVIYTSPVTTHDVDGQLGLYRAIVTRRAT